MKSLAQILEQLDGLRDTDKISDWEQGFLDSVITKWYETGRKSTSFLSEKQLDVIERLYNKHFA